MDDQPPEIQLLLDELLVDLRVILDNQLIGLYLFGSLVWGDFDPEISDIDLMAVTETEIDAVHLAELIQMHAAFEARHPFWAGRIEVGYISSGTIRTYPAGARRIAVISPGEPLHIKEAGTDWYLNWYVIQEKGVAIFGPPPQSVIRPISKDAFCQAVKEQSIEWRDWVIHTKDSRPYQGYAILTMCRALYALETGDQSSKIQAARWAKQAYPRLADQIEKALRWRDEWRDRDVDPAITYPETETFVRYVADLIIDQGMDNASDRLINKLRKSKQETRDEK